MRIFWRCVYTYDMMKHELAPYEIFINGVKHESTKKEFDNGSARLSCTLTHTYTLHTYTHISIYIYIQIKPRCARALQCSIVCCQCFSMAMFSESFFSLSFAGCFSPPPPLSLSLSLSLSFFSQCLSLVCPPHNPMHFSPPWPIVVPHFLFVSSFFLYYAMHA